MISRNIQIFSNGVAKKVDLYNLIYGLNPRRVISEIIPNDSVIVVPKIQNTMAILGSVSSPGIYEISNKNLAISTLCLVGLKPDGLNFLKISIFFTFFSIFY